MTFTKLARQWEQSVCKKEFAVYLCLLHTRFHIRYICYVRCCHTSELSFSPSRPCSCMGKWRNFDRGHLQGPAALHRRKRSLYPMNKRWRGLLSLSGRFGKESFAPYRKSNYGFSVNQPVITVITPTELSRHHQFRAIIKSWRLITVSLEEITR